MSPKLRHLLVTAIVTWSAAACVTDQGGHSYLALNQSDRDVIVDVVADDKRTLRLPANTRGHLSGSWSGPMAGWAFTIRDASCTQVVVFDLEDQPPRVTLWVTAAGEVTLARSSVWSWEGRDVRLLSPLPTASCATEAPTPPVP